MSDEKNTASASATVTFPIFSILTIIFVIAKIMGKIDWSWWLVFLPLWGPFAVLLSLLAILGVIWLVFVLIALALGAR